MLSKETLIFLFYWAETSAGIIDDILLIVLLPSSSISFGAFK